jgi:hypothetical protein
MGQTARLKIQVALAGRPEYGRIGLTILVGLCAAGLCYAVRRVLLGAGDFSWALYTARDLLQQRDPYAFAPSNLNIPYPLPAAVFGAPFVFLSDALASALFFGLSSSLLAYGILARDTPWRLLVFFSFPYVYALLVAQWSPLIMAAWFFPLLAPLLVLVKPQAAIPVAINRSSRAGVLVAASVWLLSLVIYPAWPWRWLAMLGQYEYSIPLLSLPFGPLLLGALWRWRSPRARLLLGMATLPFRAAYDLVPLWLIPQSPWQMALLVALSWLVPFLNYPLAITVRAHWAIPILFIPALVFIFWPPAPTLGMETHL